MDNETLTEYIFIFNSVHRVMKAERILKKSGAKFALLPVPRQLSSDCGLSIRYTDNDYEAVKDLLVTNFSDKVLAYVLEGDGYRKLL